MLFAHGGEALSRDVLEVCEVDPLQSSHLPRLGAMGKESGVEVRGWELLIRGRGAGIRY